LREAQNELLNQNLSVPYLPMTGERKQTFLARLAESGNIAQAASQTEGLPDGAPVSSFAADFAFFDTRLPTPGPPELPTIFWNPRIPNPGPPESPFVFDRTFLDGVFSEGSWTLTLLLSGGWAADWEYEPEKS
jgi:hypothetical protein